MATKVYELIAPCHFGLEAVLKKEILDLGYEIAQVEDGKVTFLGDAEAICRANIFLRTTERILLKVGSFKAVTFEELFQGTKARHGRNISRRMAVFGSRRPIPSRASFLARLISSPS